MKITSELTDAAITQVLGKRLAQYRIEAGLTQAELAERAGIGKRTVERIEAGHGAELVTFIRILRTLKIAEGFERLLPELPPSPIEQLKLRGKQRRRVSHSRGRHAETDHSNQVRERDPTWTWRVSPPDGLPPVSRSRAAKRKA